MKYFIARTLFLLALATSAFAFNTSFLQDAPVRYFTDQDFKILTATAQHALDHSPNNTKVTWQNPATGAHGTLTPLNTTKENGRTCRRLKIFDSAKGRSGEATYKMCKVKNEWKAF